MADPEDDAIRPCKGTIIDVCQHCKSVHITLLDADMQPVAISNISFRVWLETIEDTVDDIAAMRGEDEQPAAEEIVH